MEFESVLMEKQTNSNTHVFTMKKKNRLIDIFRNV